MRRSLRPRPTRATGWALVVLGGVAVLVGLPVSGAVASGSGGALGLAGAIVAVLGVGLLR